jgi:hypothetical protein
VTCAFGQNILQNHMVLNPLLNSGNFRKGFLIDEELMAGVSEDSSVPGTYIAFVMQHTTGEYLGYQPHTDLDVALRSINQIPRPWVYEASGGCGEGNCSVEEGKPCAGSACKSKICEK